MLFSTIEFIFFFLPAVLAFAAISKLLPYRAELMVILGSSLLFYAYYHWSYLILIGASAGFNFAIAALLGEQRHRSLYIFGVVANLGLLAYFKYVNFFLSNIDAVVGTHYPHLTILLPLAISFITFEQIAFLSDVYFGRTPRGTFLQYVAFITFFPKLIAGPIIRYGELYPQFQARKRLSFDSFTTGLCIFSIGLFKKVAIADQMAPIVDKVYGSAATTLVPATDALWATIAYAAQIYFDFSAYSDMAIGMAWMLGLILPLNFLSPYKATSLIDFWRRWHMTLSRFLRDYLYIPLGGSRLGINRTYINLLIVMVLGGLWHGAGWTFVIWGAIHGVALIINHLWRDTAKYFPRLLFEPASLGWLLTIFVVMVGWVFFRAANLDTAQHIFRSIAVNWTTGSLDAESQLIVFVAWITILIAPNTAELFKYKVLRITNSDFLTPIPVVSTLMVVIAALAFTASVIFIVSGHVNSFIYFQF